MSLRGGFYDYLKFADHFQITAPQNQSVRRTRNSTLLQQETSVVLEARPLALKTVYLLFVFKPDPATLAIYLRSEKLI